MRATRLQRVWIFLRSVMSTLKICVLQIIATYQGKSRRELSNQWLQEWAGRMLDLVGLSYRVFNPNNIYLEPGKPYIIMSNHQSYYDIPLLFKAFPGSMRMMAKQELFRIPIWGQGLLTGEFVSIDRFNRKQAVKDLQKARQIMESGITLWISPEGTRSRVNRLQPFKKGGFMLAYQTGATILPVGICGTDNVLPPDSWAFNLNQHAEIHIGQPIDTSTYSIKQRSLLMKEVEEQIKTLVGKTSTPKPVSIPTGQSSVLQET